MVLIRKSNLKVSFLYCAVNNVLFFEILMTNGTDKRIYWYFLKSFDWNSR